MWWVLIAAVAAVLGADVQRAQGGIIVGRIIASDSTPIAGARVVINGGTQVATTDSSGNFVVGRTPSGVHVIELVHRDYQSFRVPPVLMPISDTLRLTAMLQRLPRPGREADSVRAERLARAGSGESQAPVLILNGAIAFFRLPDGSLTSPNPPEVDLVAIDIMTSNLGMRLYGARAYYGVVSVITRH